MPSAKDGKRADAQSKETTFSGLPKSVKLVTGQQVNPWVAGTLNIYSYNLAPMWNYGGYTFALGGAVNPISGIYIPEPGLYKVEASFRADRPSTPQMEMVKNGIAAGNVGNLDGFFVSWSMPAAARGASIAASSTVECKAQDLIQIQVLVDTGMNPQVAYFGITKLGGQY